MVDVSIITNCHQEGRLSRATMLSVRACIDAARQAGIKVEWLVVRDCPNEATVQCTEQYCLPEAQIIDVNFKDLSLARNAGAKAASGRNIAFIDADDLWSRNWIVEAYRFMEMLPNEKIILHPEWALFFEAQEFLWRVYDCSDQDFDARTLLAYNSWCMSCFGKREVYVEHPYHPNDLKRGFGYEDWHWNCETTAAGIKHKIVPDTLYCVRVKSWQESLVAKTNEQKSIIFPSKFFAASA